MPSFQGLVVLKCKTLTQSLKPAFRLWEVKMVKFWDTRIKDQAFNFSKDLLIERQVALEYAKTYKEVWEKDLFLKEERVTVCMQYSLMYTDIVTSNIFPTMLILAIHWHSFDEIT